ncbi:MAG TPA: RHS repeat-associated core domain-containing protein, partial [Gemmatimonadaceae bacterium]
SSPSAYFELAPTPNGPAAWSGSLIEGQRDASGLLYKRNRYYDPASGRFTSQDPLGLGGGLNVYGFAGGDPVNQDDPFGLCPYSGKERNTNLDDCPDDKRRDAFKLLNRNALGRSYIKFVAASGIDINLHHGPISCGGSQAEGCSEYINMRTTVDDALGAADLASVIVHETQHFINNLNALSDRTIHVGSFSSDEIHAYAAGFTFLNTLPAAMRATSEYGPWASAYMKNPRAELHAICIETGYTDCK